MEEVEVEGGSRDQPKGLDNNTMTGGDEGGDEVMDKGRMMGGAMKLLEESKAEKEAEAARLKELAKVGCCAIGAWERGAR